MPSKFSIVKLGAIDGVKVLPRGKIPDERGTIMHGVRSDELLNPFGEVYFKRLYAGVVNGWHVHETMALNFLCIQGMIKLVLFDVRENSPTRGFIQELFIGDDNHCLVHIPPGIANGSKGMTAPYAIMCNVASETHKPDIRYVRIDPHSGEIPYNWARRDF
jgi:dTDP-4-dehydrorhamnose 3,5-epimerase